MYSRMMFSTGLTVIGLLLTMVPLIAHAQDTATPSPAPSKTPTPTGQTESTISDSTEEPHIEPWTQTDLAILTGNVQRPNGITWFNNQLYVACSGDSTLYELDSVTGATRTYIWGVRSAHTLYAEQSTGGELNLWVPDFQANRLLRIDRNGTATVNTDLARPWGIALLNENEFLISNLETNNIVIVNRQGAARELLTGLRSPAGITTDDENIYIANTGSARRGIEWISKQEALENEQASSATKPLVSGLQNTTGVTMASDGYLYFAYALGTRGVIGRVDPETCRSNGGCTNDQIEIVVFTELAAPLAGLTISPDMRLFVHTIFSPDIYWVQLGAQEPSDAESS